MIIAACYSSAGFAQELFMPRNIKQAYTNGTRSMNGQPGKNYWQNYGRYDIQVTALPPSRTVRGTERITYINNSPDTLRALILRLILNIHRPAAARDNPVNPDYLTSGITIDTFKVEGQAIRWNNNAAGTWQSARLPKALNPKDSVQLYFSWHYDVSLQSNREGMLNPSSYFLAYFYPRVAVYDDYYGWDIVDFTDQKEFYNGFNDYQLTVNVPKNFLVWATGDLLNPDEVLQPAFAAKYKRSLSANEVIHIATQKDLDAKNVTAQNAVNSWKFAAKNVPDVAVGLSDNYVWDASSAIVDNKTGRRASVNAAYADSAADFHYMVGWLQKDLPWLSNNWPGWPYPYSKTTVFQGEADMEYPMMVNDNAFTDTSFARFVAAHEVAHTWFPFYMGINESRYAFMDEGWATTFELFINKENMNPVTAENLFKQFRVAGWTNNKTAEIMLPIITPATVLKNASYGDNAYGKPSLAYIALRELLGDEVFKKCLHTYIARWNGKHPTPWDFFYTFNDASGKNLNWFWKSWFFDNNYIDLAVNDAKKTSSGYTITVKNLGGFAAPADVLLNYADGSKETKRLNAGAWEKNTVTATLDIITKKQLQSVELKGGIFMDSDDGNNRLLVK